MSLPTQFANAVEHYAIDGLIANETQVFDMNAAVDFMDEMFAAALESGASYPLFMSGLPPSRRVLLGHDRGMEAYVEIVGPDTLQISMPFESTEPVRSQGKRTLCAGAYDAVVADRRLRNEYVRLFGDPALARLKAFSDSSSFDDLTEMCGKFTVRVGQTIEGLTAVQADAAIQASIACEFMAMPISKTELSGLPRPSRRRIDKAGRVIVFKRVIVKRSVAEGYASDRVGSRKKALHFVSGHWRVSPRSSGCKMIWGEWRIWIEGHWRGDPAHGVILHRYIAKTNEEAKRRDLARLPTKGTS